MIQITPIQIYHRDMVNLIIKDEWGSLEIVTRGKVHNAGELPGFIAHKDKVEELLGIITFNIPQVNDHAECEIVTLNSFREGSGIGSALIQEVTRYASAHACRRIWLITTNDNVHALRFYQKRGFKIKDIYVDAIKQSREIKPEIPLIGMHGIPIRDEIELEVKLPG
jgi:ribosomal protein S18 acetylase RimI-like enzyme